MPGSVRRVSVYYSARGGRGVVSYRD